MKFEEHCTTIEQVKDAVQKYLELRAYAIEVKPNLSSKGWDVTAWADARVTGLLSQIPPAA